MQTIFGILALLLFLNLLLLLLSVNREKQKKAFQSFYSKIEKARRDCYT
jgi:type II secretory pathway pseudopilin PulG